MQINLDKIPFSRAGSYFVFSRYEGNLYLRHISGGDEDFGEILQLVPQNDEYDLICDGFEMNIKDNDSLCRICFDEVNSIRIKGFNFPLKLKFIAKGYDYIIKRNGYYEFNSSSKGIVIKIKIICGNEVFNQNWTGLNCKSPEIIIDSYENFEIKIWEGSCNLNNIEDFESAVDNTKKEYERFVSSFRYGKYHRGGEIASYILWNNIISHRGFLKYDAIYMSKNYMTNIWSWDNCFNTIFLIDKHYDLALDQIRIFFELQSEDGHIPDFANDRFYCSNFCKPPILGYILNKLMKKNKLKYDDIREFYMPLKKWTLWWMNNRDDDKDLIFQYNHGNESGWDNSTIFKDNIPIETPDLNAYIAIQCECLYKMASLLEKQQEADFWYKMYKKILAKTINMWEDNKFHALDENHNKVITDSLQLLMPIILENRLPKNMLNAMADNIKNNFITDFGISTESLKSKEFNEDGYWKGAVWAPVVYLIAEAFKETDYLEISKKIKISFLNMANESYMEENFSPITGKGQRDSGFAWTSSVFLLFAEEFEA
ncbi:MAG: hypothetical protein N2448_09955 [Caloramator sp.]|nr:hypothetical protein [Caloramator sp.]